MNLYFIVVVILSLVVCVCGNVGLGTPTHHLPPVKVPTGTKKKSSKHCFLCGKKTGLATSYECRYSADPSGFHYFTSRDVNVYL